MTATICFSNFVYLHQGYCKAVSFAFYKAGVMLNSVSNFALYNYSGFNKCVSSCLAYGGQEKCVQGFGG
jgi:hypothetical protein